MTFLCVLIAAFNLHSSLKEGSFLSGHNLRIIHQALSLTFIISKLHCEKCQHTSPPSPHPPTHRHQGSLRIFFLNKRWVRRESGVDISV